MTDRREQAFEHLQTAAIEAIEAMRAFLDIAESLVKEPETVTTMARAFAEAAAAAMRPPTLAAEDGSAAEPQEQDRSGVRRIDVD